ncbi:hypothetical protein, partial [Gemmatimonas sp.]|uniref:hypothetical protein n=1 Tax=Gemmatimonas sp. TaxID=1962908 RepID=UPI003562A87F
MRDYKVTRYVDAFVLSAPDTLLAIPAPPVPWRESLLVKLFFAVFATRNCQTATPGRSTLLK